MLGPLPAEAADALAVAERNAVRLASLIDDILDVERLASGKLPLSMRRVAVRDLAERVFEAVRAFADSEGVRLEVRDPDALSAEVLGKPDRLAQVLVNLLSNAIKFCSAESPVALCVAPEPPWILLCVEDVGLGIPAEYHRFILERFRQVEGSSARRRGGAGLRLAICKSIVEQHGGAIGVESEPDRGTTFWIRVPAA